MAHLPSAAPALQGALDLASALESGTYGYVPNPALEGSLVLTTTPRRPAMAVPTPRRAAAHAASVVAGRALLRTMAMPSARAPTVDVPDDAAPQPTARQLRR